MQKLAIIIPVYNAAKTIGETLASLQSIDEGWKHVEKVVVCDDASSDESARIVGCFPFNRCPTEVIRHDKNKGEAAAYTTMVECLSDNTDWFLILHSDDLALSNFITRNIEIIELCDDKVASVSSNFYNFNDSGDKLASVERNEVLFNPGTRDNVNHTAIVGCWWHISGALVNKKLWVQMGGWNPNLPLVGDWDLVLRWQHAGYTVGHSLVATTKYRCWNSNSLSLGSYAPCTDLSGRMKVARNLPQIFSGKIRLVFAWGVFCRAVRRGIKLAILRKYNYSLNAFKIACSCFRLAATGK